MKTSLWICCLFSGALSAACTSDTTSVDPNDPNNPNPLVCTSGQKACAMACVDADLAHGCGGMACDPCPTAGANGTPACVSSASGTGCGFQCNVGFGDCDGNLMNGCEKDVNTDAQNCGSCGFACSGTCVNGACQIVMPGNGSDQACLTIDATTIYWATANANPGAVYSIPKAGGTPKQIVTGMGAPRGLAVDATNIYFTTLAGGDVVVCPLSGCPANPTRLARNQQTPYSLVIDATNAYWTNRVGGQIMKCALSGCGMNPTALATGQMGPSEIAVDATNVYWTNQSDGTVMKVPIAGGTPVQVAASGMAGARGVAVDATNLYYSQAQLGTITQVPLAGGAPTVLAMGQSSPWSIALSAGEIFWTNSRNAANGGAVLKKSLLSGSPIPRAVNQAGPLCVAVDATTLYWINTNVNSVQKVAR